jgi:hypothetical protein
MYWINQSVGGRRRRLTEDGPGVDDEKPLQTVRVLSPDTQPPFAHTAPLLRAGADSIFDFEREQVYREWQQAERRFLEFVQDARPISRSRFTETGSL